MRETKPVERSKADHSRELNRRGKTIETTIDPRHLRLPSNVTIQDDRWLESLLEDPERWDGMS